MMKGNGGFAFFYFVKDGLYIPRQESKNGVIVIHEVKDFIGNIPGFELGCDQPFDIGPGFFQHVKIRVQFTGDSG